MRPSYEYQTRQTRIDTAIGRKVCYQKERQHDERRRHCQREPFGKPTLLPSVHIEGRKKKKNRSLSKIATFESQRCKLASTRKTTAKRSTVFAKVPDTLPPSCSSKPVRLPLF